VERRVSTDERAAYLAGLAPRRLEAAAVRAHFWVFEHHEEPGRFVEFTEAGSVAEIASVHDGEVPAPYWREVQGI
jgi:hypothetical protein